MEPLAITFDQQDYRRALGAFATGVTVVTTAGSDGRHVGMTASSFTSVSLDPPLVLFCVNRGASSARHFAASTHFAVHVLTADQAHLSRRFAKSRPDKFDGVPVTAGPSGVPLLHGTLARFVCRTFTTYDGGDHIIVLGEVEQYETSEGDPLVYHSGDYCVAAHARRWARG